MSRKIKPSSLNLKKVIAGLAIGGVSTLSSISSLDNIWAQEIDCWDDGAPLPANAIKATSDISLLSAAIVTGSSEITGFGQGLVTKKRDLAADLKRLQERFSGIRIEDDKLKLRIIFESDILFDFDKAAIRSDAEESLSALVEILMGFRDKTILILGHTDSKGSDSYNDALSKKRAESVKAWLISRDELKNFSLEAIGRGERYPIAPNSQPNGNDDPEGRQKNRRVEVEIPKN